MSYHLLKTLIVEEFKRIMKEQEEPDLGSDDSSSPDGLDDLASSLDDPDMGDMGDALGGDSLDGGMETDDMGEEGMDDADAGFDDSGGGLGGGLGGGGGGFGGGDDGGFGDDSESEDTESPEEETPEPKIPEIPDDPVQGVIDNILIAFEETQDPQILLNIAKSSIQEYFGELGDASEIVNQLRAQESPVLKNVADRLTLFVRG